VTGSLAGIAGLDVTGGTFDAAATQTVRKLHVSVPGKVVVSAGELTVGDNATITPLNLAATPGDAQVDLTTRGLIVDFAPGGNAAMEIGVVRRYIIEGYASGAWNGAGIMSTDAAADASRAVGYALASEALGAGGGTFMGRAGVDGSSVLARYTVAGDANLDGIVNFLDLVALAQHYGVTVSDQPGGSWWFSGDFTYDGVVNFADLVKMAQNYGGALPDAAVPGAPVGFEADLADAFARVPEPSGWGVTALGTLLIGRRRRHRA